MRSIYEVQIDRRLGRHKKCVPSERREVHRCRPIEISEGTFARGVWKEHATDKAPGLNIVLAYEPRTLWWIGHFVSDLVQRAMKDHLK